MALPIISAEERLKERHSAKVGLVGFPGVGKTTQLKTCRLTARCLSTSRPATCRCAIGR